MTFVFDTWQMWAWHDTGKWCRANSNEWETALVTFLVPSHYSNQCRTHEQSSMKIVFRKKLKLLSAKWRPCYPSTCQGLGLYSLSGQTSYRKFSRSLETARLSVIMIVSLWNKFDRHLGSAAAEVPVSEQLKKSKPESHCLTSRDLAVRCPSA